MKRISLLVALVMSSLAPVFAQHEHSGADHKHTSPHAGIVKSAGNYHLELLQKAGTLTVYLLDKNEKPLSVSGATATALLQTLNGQVTTAKLLPVGNQQFVTTLDKATVFHKAVVSVGVGGQSVSASFDLTPAKAVNSHPAHNP